MLRTAALLLLLLPGAAECALPPEAEALRRQAAEQVFDFDYARCRGTLRRLIETDPESPFGYLFEAGAIWWQATTEYGLFKDTPTLEGLFERDVDAAISLSKTRFSSKDRAERADAYFVAGMALGVRGQWGLSRGRWMKAYFDGKKAVKYLRKCVKLAPDHHDAYLGLGIFDYQAAHLPGILKVSALMTVRGDAERGKARIRQAAENGRLVAQQAAVFLVSLLLEEGENAQALALLQGLRGDFPRSPYFSFLEVVLRHRLGDEEGSRKEAIALARRSAQDKELLQRKLLSLLCGPTGPKCLDDDGVRGALAWLDGALRAPKDRGEPPHWRTLLYLYRGAAKDILGGQRPSAEGDYRKAMTLPDLAGARQWARHCLLTPCDREEVSRILKEMSLEDSLLPTAPPPRTQLSTTTTAPDPGDD